MPAEIPRGQGTRHDETALLSILRILLEKYENIFCFPLFSHFYCLTLPLELILSILNYYGK